MIVWTRIDKGAIDPRLVAALEKQLGCSAFHYWALSGYRSIEEQRILYRRWLAREPGAGKAAPPGMSAHNYRKAVDFVVDVDPKKPGLQPSWNIKLAAWLHLKLMVQLHPDLRHGSDFGDFPHVEWKTWKAERGA